MYKLQCINYRPREMQHKVAIVITVNSRILIGKNFKDKKNISST